MARKFIIEDEGRYLVCEVELEYDPDAATTAAEREGVNQIAAMYADAQQRGACVSACEITEGMITQSPLNTGPRV